MLNCFSIILICINVADADSAACIICGTVRVVSAAADPMVLAFLGLLGPGRC